MDGRPVERRGDALMWLKGITDEDFVNYKVPSMFIATATCDFKCERDCGKQCCQNSDLVKEDPIFSDDAYLIRRYLNNRISKAIVFGGLEPFDQWPELFQFIRLLRFNFNCNDPVVIYTGYMESEVAGQLQNLRTMPNIIVKFGRYVPDQEPHMDEVLGVKLASDNQFAKQIS